MGEAGVALVAVAITRYSCDPHTYLLQHPSHPVLPPSRYLEREG